MTRTPPGRLPGEPRAGDRDYGPLGGLADDVHHFVKARQRDEDALARTLRRPLGERRGFVARVRTLVARLRR